VDDYTSVWSDKIKGLLTIAFSSSATSSVIDAHLSYPVSEELRYQLARIERTRALKADWDGMGAIAPSQATVRMAKRAVKDLGYAGFIPNHIGAGPNGELFIEFKAPGKRQAQVYFSAEDGNELLLIEGDEYPYEGAYRPHRLLDHLHGK